MSQIRVELTEITLPAFGEPIIEPTITRSEYEARLLTLMERATARGLDALLVYSDREHSANLVFLVGFDPRFEEAVLLVGRDTTPVLLVGNECWASYASVSPLPVERRLYQHFSLLGQDRAHSEPLAQILVGCGIGSGQRIAVIDWKYFGSDPEPQAETQPEFWICAPAYLVEAVRCVTGVPPVNATDLLMNPRDGMRATNSVDQLACFEYAGASVTNAMRRVMWGLAPGMSEYEAMQQACVNGAPPSMHPVLMSGPRVALGLASPSSRRMQLGEPLMLSIGVWGALSTRSGFLVHERDELPLGIRDYVERLVAPYFSAAVDWYERIGVGVRGGELFDVVHRRLADPFFGLLPFAGHLIHLDEWVHCPTYPGSDVAMLSGTALNTDIIPSTGGPYFSSHIEDTIALAGEDLREGLASRWPEAWSRIQARRAFMQDVLGIQLKAEVLPLSNLAAFIAPYLLNPGLGMRVVGR